MELPPLPPSDDVYAALKLTVIPSAAVAGFAYALLLSLRRRAGAFGSAAAVLAGMAYANWLELRLPWNPDPSRVVRIAWEWLPRSALLLVLVGLVSHWIGLALARALPSRRAWLASLAIWLPRAAATFAVAYWLVPERVREPHVWLLPAFAAVAFLEWVILDGLARGAGGSISVPFSQAAMFFAASVVILYSHSARFMDVSVMAGAAYFGIGIVGFLVRPADCSGAIPAGVGLLPGLLLSTKVGTESQVPLTAYFLVALSPLVLAPWLAPGLARRKGTFLPIAQLLLVTIPLVVAVALAARVESLPWETEW